MSGRKHPIHLTPYAGGNRPVIVYVTVVTRLRQPCLANDPAHGLLRKIWSAADFWIVGRYVVMPDHLHFFCAPTAPDFLLEKWMQYWKSQIRPGRSLRKSPSSSVITGIANCVRRRATMRNGITCGKTQSAPVSSPPLTRGRIKAS